jgi:hypothetical protein
MGSPWSQEVDFHCMLGSSTYRSNEWCLLQAKLLPELRSKQTTSPLLSKKRVSKHDNTSTLAGFLLKIVLASDLLYR